MSQMKLGWWRDRGGMEHMVDVKHEDSVWPWWSSVSMTGWDAGGFWDKPQMETERDLIEFLRPLEDLPPALNAAVKAAEDRVRELNDMVAQTATAWATARRLREAAQRELERLEKECEAGK